MVYCTLSGMEKERPVHGSGVYDTWYIIHCTLSAMKKRPIHDSEIYVIHITWRTVPCLTCKTRPSHGNGMNGTPYMVSRTPSMVRKRGDCRRPVRMSGTCRRVYLIPSLVWEKRGPFTRAECMVRVTSFIVPCVAWKKVAHSRYVWYENSCLLYVLKNNQESSMSLLYMPYTA